MFDIGKALKLVDRSRRSYGVKFSLDDLDMMEESFLALYQKHEGDETLRKRILCLVDHIRMTASVGN